MDSTVLMVIILHLCPVLGNEICTFGEKLQTSREGINVCIVCQDGTFMSEKNHTNRDCNKCATIKNNSLEVETTKCNRTHDAVIDCVCDYYRYMARRKGEKDECRPNKNCQLPEIDTANDTENSNKGKSPFNDTFGSGERNKCLNTTTEPQDRATFDFVTLVTCVTLIVILVSTLYNFLSKRKHKQFFKRPHGRNFSHKLRNHQDLIFGAIWGMLFAFLIFCIFNTTEPIILSNAFNKVFVSVTVIATGVFISVVINGHECSCRQTDKSRDNKESQHPELGEDDHFQVESSRSTHGLKRLQSDTEKQEVGEEETEKLNRE